MCNALVMTWPPFWNYQYFIIYTRDQMRFTAYGLHLTTYGLRLTAYGSRLTAYGFTALRLYGFMAHDLPSYYSTTLRPHNTLWTNCMCEITTTSCDMFSSCTMHQQCLYALAASKALAAISPPSGILLAKPWAMGFINLALIHVLPTNSLSWTILHVCMDPFLQTVLSGHGIWFSCNM